jgi:hypothetical protein
MMIGKVWRRRSILFLLILLINSLATLGQDVKVRAGFLADSIRVGDEVFFYLAAYYPKNRQLVFPDTTFSFSPFELKRKDYFPTKTKDTVSYDSAVYSLRTFEINREQSLRLPVFIINNLDCTRVFSNRDTVLLQHLVKKIPDSLTANIPVRATIAYQEVPSELNVLLIIIVTTLLTLISGIGWVMLGPGVRRYFKIKKLKKVHAEFIQTYERYLDRLKAEFSPKETESAIVLWKKYMEQISKRPYTKLTTQETTRLEKDELLGKNLRMVDGAIYGSNTNVIESLQSLRTFADQRFNHVISEVENG